MNDAEVRERIVRLEELLGAVEGDAVASEAVAALVEVYGEALRRFLAGADPAADELLSHLLLVHDLHPVDVETRVTRALEEVRPYLESHGGDVELLEIADGVVRLRLQGTCNGCPSSSATLRHAIEEAIERAAPEVVAVEADGVAEPTRQLLQISSLQCPTELTTA
jgi:Fe-S cluster biogenesis protein NfuA